MAIITLILVFLFSLQSLTYIATLLCFILLCGIIPLYERKKLSLIQRRVGPKFTGFNGRLQFLADALKIFLKDFLYIFSTTKFYFFLLPVLTLFFNLFFLLSFQWNSNIFFFDIELNYLFLSVLSSISNILVFLTGYICKNKYTIITSSRTASVFFINELFLSLIILFLVYFSKSYSIFNFIASKGEFHGYLILLPILPILIFFFLLEVNKVPFDFQEAESELIMGYTNEYSGFLFGVYVLIEYLHIVVYLYFFSVILF